MTVGLALIPIIMLIISLVIALNFLGAGPHIPLVFSTAIACLVALKAGTNGTILKNLCSKPCPTACRLW